MEFKGTKGKWCVVGDAIHDRVTKFDKDGARIGDTASRICTVDIQSYQGEQEANAKLIATAPELLEALQSILNISEDKGRSGCTYGDTDFDSLSAAYGYNTALEHIKSKIKPIIKKAIG